jgi:predicted nucleic acid-binding protein
LRKPSHSREKTLPAHGWRRPTVLPLGPSTKNPRFQYSRRKLGASRDAAAGALSNPAGRHDRDTARIVPAEGGIETLKGAVKVSAPQDFKAARHKAMVEKNLDWTDAVVAAQMPARKQSEIYSYDRDFDGPDGVTRLEP